MSAHTDIQVILGPDGNPEFAVIPFAEYKGLVSRARSKGALKEDLIPHEVVGLLVSGMSVARAWREHLGLSQAEVAKRLKITQAALSQIESGKSPRTATLKKLAKALGISVDQLLG
jgi:predicted transcriptional regulator